MNSKNFYHLTRTAYYFVGSQFVRGFETRSNKITIKHPSKKTFLSCGNSVYHKRCSCDPVVEYPLRGIPRKVIVCESDRLVPSKYRFEKSHFSKNTPYTIYTLNEPKNGANDAKQISEMTKND